MSSLILIDDTACHVDAAVAIGASGARVGGCDGVTRDVVAAALEAYTCRVERGGTCQMDTSGGDTCQMDTSGDVTLHSAEDEYSAAELSQRAALVGEGRSRRDAFEEVRREKQQRLHRAGEARANSEVRRRRDDALCNRVGIAATYDHALIAP